MGNEASTHWSAGLMIGERYCLESRIAGGGMGEVWRGQDTVLGRAVAIKVLRSEHAQDADFRERLRREARAAGSISHAHVVPIFDFGDAAQDDGTHLSYLIMGLVEGPALAAELNAGPISVERSMQIVEQTALALQAAHDAGIVHRDIKPANILIDPSGDAKITDFGIARAGDEMPMTRTGMLTGTAKYLSPEQAGGKTATPASDIYALGVVAYQCLTGSVPFAAGTDVAIALAHIQDDPPQLPDSVPEDVRALVMSMLDKTPESRPGPASWVAQTAHVLATGRHVDPEATGIMAVPYTAASRAADASARSAATQPAMMRPDATQPAMTQTQQPLRTSRRNRLLPWLLVAVIAAVAAVLGFTYLGGGAEVPDVVGEQVSDAKVTLSAEGLLPKITKVDVAGKDSGVVLDQSPKAGVEIDEGREVDLTVASGRVEVPTDDLIGLTYVKAAAVLKKLGLKAAKQTEISSRTAGTVIGVNPTSVAKNGSAVTLTLAAAIPPPVIVQSPPPSNDDNAKDNAEDKNKGEKKAKDPKKKKQSKKDKDEDAQDFDEDD